MAKLLDRDALKHVADARVLDVERLHPILQGRLKFAGGSAELLQEIRAEASIRGPYIDRLEVLCGVKKWIPPFALVWPRLSRPANPLRALPKRRGVTPVHHFCF